MRFVAELTKHELDIRIDTWEVETNTAEKAIELAKRGEGDRVDVYEDSASYSSTAVWCPGCKGLSFSESDPDIDNCQLCGGTGYAIPQRDDEEEV